MSSLMVGPFCVAQSEDLDQEKLLQPRLKVDAQDKTM